MELIIAKMFASGAYLTQNGRQQMLWINDADNAWKNKVPCQLTLLDNRIIEYVEIEPSGLTRRHAKMFEVWYFVEWTNSGSSLYCCDGQTFMLFVDLYSYILDKTS